MRTLCGFEQDEKETPASSTASRFAYDVLASEADAVKAPSVKRGKDGHVSLGASGDFFSNPSSFGTAAKTK